ncbi:MAG TPA: hypothetical protein CFH82_05535 [Sulfurospirillum sp. UBA12182]|nr:MAG TPA: hypothetical protein CFH82_05535 [Sulfurospirillum sp. UBA12182]
MKKDYNWIKKSQKGPFLENILKKIEELSTLCEQTLNSPNFKTQEEDKNIALQIKAFNGIISDCKMEVKNTDFAHKEYILKTLYDLDINHLTYLQIEEKLDLFLKNHIGSDEDYEGIISLLKKIIYDLDNISQSIQYQVEAIVFTKQSPLFLFEKKLNRYNEKLIKIKKIKDSLQKKLELVSEYLANQLIENFYNFFIFISFLLNTPKIAKNDMLLIKIANILTRYIEIIEPALSNRSLHYKDMIYHYALFEIKELKEQILKSTL